MKTSAEWIQEYLGRTMSVAEIVEALERAGIEVEQYSSSKVIDRNVVVATVKKVVQHPNADKLKIVEVAVEDGSFRVVCGASNVREGMLVAFAKIGSLLPDGDVIREVKLRGEVSEGMICSERELGIGEDHKGILEIVAQVPLGTPLCDLYPADGYIDIKTPANRFDLLGVAGIARDVAAMSSTEYMLPSSPAVPVVKEDDKLGVDALAARYTMIELDVRADAETPLWMAARLRTSGVRSINAVVDITNYVMLETGQPMHAFDYDKIKFPVAVRYARKGEKIQTIDGNNRVLTPEDLVVADAVGPIALAGVMGGTRTEVSPATRKIVLEAATFGASIVRKMAKRHNLRTEASARFERGLPVQLVLPAAYRAIEFLGKLTDAKVHSAIDQLNVWPWIQRIGLSHKRLRQITNTSITQDEAISSLASLGIIAKSFDFKHEARALIGASYKRGARYRDDGVSAFDCSYLVDYVYSLIGVSTGHTALAQYMIGRPIDDTKLKPGDALFLGGDTEDDIVQDCYSIRDSDGRFKTVVVDPPVRVGHVGLYLGNKRVVQASSTDGAVVEVALEEFTGRDDYLGARRFADDLEDFISVPEVPWWRPDLKIAEDLIEEIVRVIGYERIPSTIPPWRPKRVEFDVHRVKRREIRDVLYAAGLFEVMTYSFVSEDQIVEDGGSLDAHLKLKNPQSLEQAYMRSSLLPSHLGVLTRNRMYKDEVGFYEIANVFEARAPGLQPDEPLKLGVMIRRQAGSYAAIKGLVDALARALNVSLTIRPADVGENVAPGRGGGIELHRNSIGVIGQVHPGRLEKSKINNEAAFFEIDLAPLFDATSPRQSSNQRRLPMIERDITVVVPKSVLWGDIKEALSPLGAPVAFIGDYYAADLPEGHKSLTLRVRLIKADKTPTESEANELESKVIRLLEQRASALPRL